MPSFQIIAASLLTLSSFAASDIAPFNNSQDAKEGVFGNYSRQSYLSDDHVVGPVVNVIVPPQQGVSPSKYITWAPGGPKLPKTQPMLIDAKTFATVWAGPAMDGESMSPAVQSCNGSQYISWWSGGFSDGFKQGQYHLVNSNYKIVYNITGQLGLTADAHELVITPQCTAIISAYSNLPYDLSQYNITDGWLVDSYFQEIDLATGELLFHWQATQAMPDIKWEAPHRPPQDHQGQSENDGHDWFHINSVEKDHKGNYLVSSRHTCTIYYISGMTGAVIWRLGGHNSDFRDLSEGKATDFAWQHDARWLNDDLTRLSLYDDRTAGPRHRSKEPLSRGIILELNYAEKTVKLERTYYATRGIESDREGNMQVLRDSPTTGNVMIGYGQEPAFTEFSANGTVLLDVALGPLFLERDSPDNYRALKVNWTGMPYWGPSIAPGPKPDYVYVPTNETFSVRMHDDFNNPAPNDTAYFSWNGATEIKSWVVLASNTTTNLSITEHFLTEVPKSGFEDNTPATSRYMLALAVNATDFVLGTTAVLDMAADAFQRVPGAPGPNADHMPALTAAWQAYVAKQPRDSLFARLRAKWHAAVARPGVAAGAGSVALVCLLALASVPAWLYLRRANGRRAAGGRYAPAPDGEEGYSYEDELKVRKTRVVAFEDADSERTYCDVEDGGEEERFYVGKESIDDGGDLATLRSSSSSSGSPVKG